MQASNAAWRVWVAEYAESRGALLGAVLLLGLLLLAVLAPWVAPQNPYDLAQLDILNAKLPPGQLSMDGMVFWLGTDEQGRDLWSGILYGLRTSLWVGTVSTLLAVVCGLVMGLSAAYFGGWVDTLIMRLVDFQLSFPAILLALILLAKMNMDLKKTAQKILPQLLIMLEIM